jgi:hypothetical protein
MRYADHYRRPTGARETQGAAARAATYLRRLVRVASYTNVYQTPA